MWYVAMVMMSAKQASECSKCLIHKYTYYIPSSMAKKFLQDQDSIANVTGDIDLYFESKVTNQLLTATGPNDRDKVVVLPQRQACPPPPPPPPSPGAGLQQWWVDTYKRDNFQFFLKVKGDKKDVNKPVECPVGDDTQAFINVQGDAVANCGIQVCKLCSL